MTTDVRTRPLLSRELLLCFAAIVGCSIAFYLPLAVVPMVARQSGAGMSTAALLLSTVVCELATPRLIARVGYQRALGLGLILLGAPLLLLTTSHGTALIVAVSVVRGAGFAITVVTTNAIAAMVIPAARRGEGLALAGVVSGAPSILALPAGVWIAGHWGFTPVFVAAALAPLLALVVVPGLARATAARTRADAERSRADATARSHANVDARSQAGAALPRHGVVAGLGNSRLTRPAAAFALSAAAAGVLVTFLPLAGGVSSATVAAALLAQPAASTLARWVAGRLGDRYGAPRLFVPGLVLSAGGMAALSMLGQPAAVIGGALVFGAGFGILQNASLQIMYARTTAGGEGAVSAIWNAAYDLGMAAGALGAGLVIAPLGYPGAFLLTALAILPALALLKDTSCRSAI
jgi:MFS family permease